MPELKRSVSGSRKALFILSGTILLTFVFLLGYLVGLNQLGSQKDADYETVASDIKEKLVETGLLPPVVKTNSVSGKVTVVGANFLELEALQVINSPLEEPAPIQRRVAVGADTEIVKSTPKTMEEIEADSRAFQVEQEKFDKIVAAGDFEAIPPEPPPADKITEMSLADIMQGDHVYVTAANDITYATDIAATKIVVFGGTAAALEDDVTDVEPPLPTP